VPFRVVDTTQLAFSTRYRPAESITNRTPKAMAGGYITTPKIVTNTPPVAIVGVSPLGVLTSIPDLLNFSLPIVTSIVLRFVSFIHYVSDIPIHPYGLHENSTWRQNSLKPDTQLGDFGVSLPHPIIYYFPIFLSPPLSHPLPPLSFHHLSMQWTVKKQKEFETQLLVPILSLSPHGVFSYFIGLSKVHQCFSPLTLFVDCYLIGLYSVLYNKGYINNFLEQFWDCSTKLAYAHQFSCWAIPPIHFCKIIDRCWERKQTNPQYALSQHYFLENHLYSSNPPTILYPAMDLVSVRQKNQYDIYIGNTIYIEMRQQTSVNGINVEVLRVPWYPQRTKEWTCVPCSIWMCLAYFKNVYENKIINNKAPSPDLGYLIDILHTRPTTGTIVDRGLCTALDKEGWPFEYSYKSSNFKELKRYLGKNIPVTVIYDGSYLLDERPGPAHAGVVIGMTNNDDVVLNNPWYGPFYFVDKLQFERAWENKYNRAIIIKPVPQSELEVEVTE